MLKQTKRRVKFGVLKLPSEMREDGIILDYKGRRLVGVTILDASQRYLDTPQT
ncbi:MAG: DUF2283 domain-containing protein [Deltaproteobacteria bacterium]|nr:DUF2283 domain-containing protein [Deltaproteobacteria bacterium]MBI2367745.1 DUF2283 domain-containing protein [Deltaproteobacteria bacterium]MBI2531027.1 DUF2283 domain-containing protein [Deltaproteobacteria bacterium]MBI3066413.1 DUF2283 domain-containing protein [Deltaproteobacteria bacterium]